MSLSGAMPAAAQMVGTAFPNNQATGRNSAQSADETNVSRATPNQNGQAVPGFNPMAPPPSASAVPASAAQIGQPVRTGGNTRQVDETPVTTSLGDRLPPAPPGEFEKYTAQILGRPVPRFGATLLLPSARNFTPPSTASVPPDYRLNPGDEISIGLTGSVESDLRLQLDNEGAVFIPRVGRVSLVGVRYADLPSVLRRKISQEYRDFRISVSITQLHGIRVYVTGYAASPGSYSLNALSTLVNAVLSAGGPNAGGSFRSIQLRRNGRLISDFDLYDLLLRGDKTKDAVLQNEDVVYISPVGPQVALTGSVNAEAIYEARPGETIADLLSYSGGISTLADPSRTIVSRLSELDRRGWIEISLAQAAMTPVMGGDILRLLSLADYARPLERQNILVTIEGEVGKPGHFYMPAGSTMGDALALAGGLTSRSFVFGTEFDRSRVQQEQQRGFDEAIQQLELSLAAAPLTAAASGPEDAAIRAQQLVAARIVVDRLRQKRPDGRVILGLQPGSRTLPLTTLLENNDRLYLPPEPTTVGVFGAVFRPGSFHIDRARRVSDYLQLAGGPQRIADKAEIFVVRANGEVISRRNGGLSRRAVPGDVIFVPVKTHSTTFWARLRDVSQLLLGAGLTGAGIAALLD